MLILAQQLLANNKPDNLTDKPVEDVQRILSCGSNLLTLINEILAVNWAKASETKTSFVTIVDDRANLQPADKSILIIEEDRRFSSVLRELAQAKGFKCIITEEGKTGLQLALKYQPNAILLDVDLPHLSGWTIMEKLKENLDIRHIPVYLFSAADAFKAAKKRGAIGYLHKPMSMAQLREIFKKIEQFLTRCVKNLLVVVDFDVHLKKILELVEGEDTQIKLASTIATAFQHLTQVTFDCIIIDMDMERGSFCQLLEQMQKEPDLCQIPVIVYAERDLTSSEEELLLQCADNIPLKLVKSKARLLDETTLFFHQKEANLPDKKRNLLRQVHDKKAILANKKVLIADDDVRFYLPAALEDFEMEIVIGSTGKEAMFLLEEHPDIAIVLMDTIMPEMDGYDAMREIRKHHSSSELPIIAIGTKAMKDKAKSIEAGANDYLEKPLDIDKLISKMCVWLYR